MLVIQLAEVGDTERTVEGVLSSLFRGLHGLHFLWSSFEHTAMSGVLLHAVTDTHLEGAPR